MWPRSSENCAQLFKEPPDTALHGRAARNGAAAGRARAVGSLEPQLRRSEPDLTANSRSGPWASAWLALRSLLWTILLPGVIAGYLPWRFFGLGLAQFRVRAPHAVLGVLCVAMGTMLLAACIFEFARSGRGTLSPADPPRHLVVRGLYRYVRNPMYLSVTIIVLGEALLAYSPAIALYWAIWFVGANLLVIGYEEPALRRRFGASYEEYTQHVGRWLPRFRGGDAPN